MRRELAELSFIEKAALLAVLVWFSLFLGTKLPHLFSPTWIEWDARAMALAAFRFHGSGLFPRDLGADLASGMCPPGWKLLFWIGTWFTDPYQVSRLLPLGIFAFLVWQAFAFARNRGGLVIAATTVFLLARCPFVWDRIAGANPRAFGLPLVIAFLRYATEQRPRAVATVLIAQAAFYPSVLLLCAPAFAVLQLVEAVQTRKLAPLVVLAIAGAGCVLFALPTVLFVDPRLGPPITLEQLAALKQRAMWSLYPLPPHRWAFARAAHIALEDEIAEPLFKEPLDRIFGVVTMWTCAAVFAIGLVRRRVPAPFLALAASSLGAYFLACAVAYRLYVPDRLLHYASPPILLLLFAPLVVELLTLLPERRRPRHTALLGCLIVATLTVLAGGTGISRFDSLHDYSGARTPTTSYLGKVRKDALVAAHPSLSSFVEVFSHRSTLFSGITNAPNFVQYGRTTEERIAAFYDAYYATTLEQVRAFCHKYGVDYLVVDQRDYGGDAYKRARYVSPWTEYAQARLLASRGQFALKLPPASAIIHRDGFVLVLDTSKL